MSLGQSCDSLDLAFAESLLLELKNSGKPAIFMEEFPPPGAALPILPGYKDAHFPFPGVHAGYSCTVPGLRDDSVSVGAWYDVNVSSG